MVYERPPGFLESLGPRPPDEYYVEANAVSVGQVEGFEKLVRERSGEKKLDEYLRDNRELLAHFLGEVSTGHQGAWVISQQQIKAGRKGIEAGLVPDYLLCGRSSDGYAWWVMELKGANERIFSKRSGGRIGFSSNVNQWIFQLLEYIVFCDEQQGYLRDQLKLTDFTDPRGMLVIGTEDEFNDPELQKRKSAWNRVTSGNLQIRTYDALVRSARPTAELFKKGPPKLEDFDTSRVRRHGID